MFGFIYENLNKNKKNISGIWELGVIIWDDCFYFTGAVLPEVGKQVIVWNLILKVSVRRETINIGNLFGWASETSNILLLKVNEKKFVSKSGLHEILHTGSRARHLGDVR